MIKKKRVWNKKTHQPHVEEGKRKIVKFANGRNLEFFYKRKVAEKRTISSSLRETLNKNIGGEGRQSGEL